MAVYSEMVAGHRVKINDRDHHPPHCHVNLGRRNKRVCLDTLRVLNPPPDELPPRLRRALRKRQAELLEAWDEVIVDETERG